MLNNKGQALVEFIIIIPILVILLISAVDFINITREKTKMESVIEDVINGEESDDVLINEKDDKIVYEIKSSIDLSSPILSLILGSPYEIRVERVINNE